MQRRLLFEGTATALVTPFRNSGEVDQVALRKLVDLQLRAKVDALVPVGSTGEGATLSEREQALVIETVAEQVNGRVPVIAGASSNSTAVAMNLARQAKSCGADAVMIVAPYYNKPTQEGLIQHFSSIAGAVDLPLLMYNVPGRTASNIESSTVLRLAESVPTIAGVKEASGNFGQVMEILRHRPRGFGVWSGEDNLSLALIALGAEGVVSVVSNQVPKWFAEMVRYALAGKWRKARELHYQLLPLMNINFIESNPIPVKTALHMMGLIDGTLRLPLVPMSGDNRDKLELILRALKLVK